MNQSFQEFLNESFARFRKAPKADLDVAWAQIRDRAMKEITNETQEPRFVAAPAHGISRWRGLAASALLISVALVALVPLMPMTVGAPAVLRDGQGSRNIGFGEVVRPNGGSGGTLTLTNGTLIEMRSEAELSLERVNDSVRVRLRKGDVIVDASSKQANPLQVDTKDMSATGTLFLVSATEAGSRVAALRGVASVQQGSAQRTLSPGQQISTDPALEAVREIPWQIRSVHLAELVKQGPGTAEPRETPLAPGRETTSASLEGLVLDALTGQPVSGFTVRGPRPAMTNFVASETSRLAEQNNTTAILQSSARAISASTPPNANRPSLESLRTMTTTEDTGRFLLDGITPGRTEIAFSKLGYVPQTLTYTLVPGRRTGGLVIRATPTGVVSGRVVDATGRPAVDVRVTAFAFGNTANMPQQRSRGETTTNDRGEYRLFNLEPDRYFIGFQQPLVRSSRPPFSVAEGATLYPGVDSFSRTEFIDVKGGLETRLKDTIFSTEARLGEVQIHIRNGSTEPAKDVSFWFMNTTGSESIATTAASLAPGSRITGGRSRPPLNNVCKPDLGRPCDLGQIYFRAEPGVTVEKTYWPTLPGTYEAGAHWTDANGVTHEVTQSLDYRGEKADIALTLQADGRISMRALGEQPDGTTTPITDTVSANVCSSKSGCLSLGLPLGIRLLKGVADASGLPPGRYYFVTLTGPANMYAVSIRQSGKDVFTEGFVVSKDSDPVEIRFRSGAPRLAGKVTNAEGRGVAGALVGILPEPPLDSNSLRALRRTVRSDQDGTFEINNLMPGSYRAYAWSSATESVFVDPGFAILKDQGTHVSVGESGEPSLTLKVLD
jgi:hypothetical protein